MTVTLRQRKKGSKIFLYLDYYDSGKRDYEHLGFYLHPKPERGRLTKQEVDHNKKMLELAEKIRSKRHLEIQSGKYGFQDKTKLAGNFLAYMQTLATKRRDKTGNWGNWDSAIKHLHKYAPKGVTFSQINKEWLEGFKEYLLNDSKSKYDKELAQNSKLSYFNKVRATLKQAAKDGIIKYNPVTEVEGIKEAESQREFLSYEELRAMYKTDCSDETLKRAFLFSALTGLRWSDIQKLTWSEVSYSKEIGYLIRFKQKKTNSFETLPISDEARKLLGKEGESSDVVFDDLKYSAWNNSKLRDWAKEAGIKKHITFHIARHTNATLQLSLGTTITTIKKLLGHKNLKTTEMYAKVIDADKIEAANKIKLEE